MLSHLRDRWGLNPQSRPAPEAEYDRRTRFAVYADRLRDRFGQGQRLALVERMWTVAFSDGAIGHHEERLMHLAGELLGLAEERRARCSCPAAGQTGTMTSPAVRAQIDRDFWLEGFRDFLALESGHSANTVEAYLRDLRRLGEFATSRGVREPDRLTRALLRDFVYLLKDLGLSAASIRRGVSRYPHLLRLPGGGGKGHRRPQRPAGEPTARTGAAGDAEREGSGGAHRLTRRGASPRLAGSGAPGACVRCWASGLRALFAWAYRPPLVGEFGAGVRQRRQGAAGADRPQRRSARSRSISIPCGRSSIRGKAVAGCC